MAKKETIAVLGAGGIMGLPIARNLARAGFDLRAWNRSHEKAAPLADDGACLCASPAEATTGADIVLTMLADADAVLHVIKDALQGVGENAVWMQMSTIGESGTERCAELARERGIAFVDAPVLGTKAPAEQGKLVILASGPEALKDRLQPIFDVVGQRTLWVGQAGAGTRLKLATNAWVLTVVEGGAETLALAAGMGIDPRLVLEAISGGALDLPYLQMKGTAMIERDFTPSFSLALAAKDAALMEEAAERHGLDLPLIRTIRDRLAEGVERHGDKDMSATYLTSASAITTSS
ncbi:MAG TPA: NAD(P)-dependent oxidoreductase [Solirubrobacteraceae bacterium]|jgi:3-hydroxyisobutyrate dehydrogenase|nr:NAD(P)-dependent oxidoreductase [Solirubrobacteraceae bacterium]